MAATEQELTVGIATFPASNCDEDAARFFARNGFAPTFIDHNEIRFTPYDLFVLPGGFAYADLVYKKATGEQRVEPGVQALESNVMKLIRKAAGEGLPVLGICNGFQILTADGLLPGRLEQNDVGHFVCRKDTVCAVENPVFGDETMVGKRYTLPIAHGYGRYIISPEEYTEMQQRGQIILQYEGVNPNGSMFNIAGVSNREGNVVATMPHPERTEFIGDQGSDFARAIHKYVRRTRNIR